MQLRSLAIVLAICPAMALAGERDFFAGLDVSGGTAEGSSSTRDGGAPFAGGGVVDKVRFGETIGIGGHIGYKFDPAMSVFLSYRHIQGDISWNANFPLLGVASNFDGSAISDALTGNVAYELPLSEVTSLRAVAGLGVTFNALSGIDETDRATGIFLSGVAGHTKTSPIARLGAGVRYKIAQNAALGLDASFSYSGGFATGNTRSGNLGVTDINPYKIDDVWRATLGVSIALEF